MRQERIFLAYVRKKLYFEDTDLIRKLIRPPRSYMAKCSPYFSLLAYVHFFVLRGHPTLEATVKKCSLWQQKRVFLAHIHFFLYLCSAKVSRRQLIREKQRQRNTHHWRTRAQPEECGCAYSARQARGYHWPVG